MRSVTADAPAVNLASEVTVPESHSETPVRAYGASMSDGIVAYRGGEGRRQAHSASRATFSRIGRQMACCDWVNAIVSSGVM
jgi:hypothetical protein